MLHSASPLPICERILWDGTFLPAGREGSYSFSPAPSQFLDVERRCPDPEAGLWSFGWSCPVTSRDRLASRHPSAHHMIPSSCRLLSLASIGPLINAQTAALISCLLINELRPRPTSLNGTFAHRFDSAVPDLLWGELCGFARSQTGGMRWEKEGVTQPEAAGARGCSCPTSTPSSTSVRGTALPFWPT